MAKQYFSAFPPYSGREPYLYLWFRPVAAVQDTASISDPVIEDAARTALSPKKNVPLSEEALLHWGTCEQREALIRELAREELVENGNWCSYQRDNRPDISL